MTVKTKAKKHITTLRMNKLKGRVMRMSAPKKRNREILLVYGHHASLERMYGFAEYLNKYGAVTVPDLPGFGGMDSFYKINKEPDIDTLADYLASFIRLRYKRRRITIVGLSFSVLVVTRMLQKYPALAKKTDLFISFVGFVHKDDFKLPRHQLLGLRFLGILFQQRLPAFIIKNTLFRPRVVKLAYKSVSDWHKKLSSLSEAKKNEVYELESELWQLNDVRTRFKTIEEMVTVDLCDARVNLPIYQINVDHDRYFDNNVVVEHMRIIFNDVNVIPSKIDNHAPSVLLESAREVAPYIPAEAKALLR